MQNYWLIIFRLGTYYFVFGRSFCETHLHPYNSVKTTKLFTPRIGFYLFCSKVCSNKSISILCCWIFFSKKDHVQFIFTLLFFSLSLSLTNFATKMGKHFSGSFINSINGSEMPTWYVPIIHQQQCYLLAVCTTYCYFSFSVCQKKERGCMCVVNVCRNGSNFLCIISKQLNSNETKMVGETSTDEFKNHSFSFICWIHTFYRE